VYVVVGTDVMVPNAMY